MIPLDSALSAHGILTALLDAALKGSLVILAAVAITWGLRRGSAATRHVVWCAAIVAQLLLPVLVVALPAWHVGFVTPPWLNTPVAAPSAPPWVANDAAVEQSTAPMLATTPRDPAPPVVDVPVTASQTTVGPMMPAPTPATSRASWRPSWMQFLALVWFAGAAGVLTRLVVGAVVVTRMGARATRVADARWLALMHRVSGSLGMRRDVALLRGGADVPLTWGLARPVVLLPADAEEWDAGRRERVLVHELAHVRRLDALWRGVAEVVVAMYWFNPLAWRAARGLRDEAERACDDQVLAEGLRASEYANDLLDFAGRLRPDRAQPAFAALAMGRPSGLEGRVRSLLDPAVPRTRPNRSRVVASVMAVTLVVVPLAAFTPVRRAAAVVRASPGAVAAPIVAPAEAYPTDFDFAVPSAGPRQTGQDGWVPGTDASLESAIHSLTLGGWTIMFTDQRVRGATGRRVSTAKQGSAPTVPERVLTRERQIGNETTSSVKSWIGGEVSSDQPKGARTRSSLAGVFTTFEGTAVNRHVTWTPPTAGGVLVPAQAFGASMPFYPDNITAQSSMSVIRGVLDLTVAAEAGGGYRISAATSKGEAFFTTRALFVTPSGAYLAVNDDSTAWLRGAPGLGATSREWVLMGMDGAIARVTLGTRETVIGADRRHLWTSEMTDRTHETITRYRIGPLEIAAPGSVP